MTSEGRVLYCCSPLINPHQFCIFFIGEFTLRAFLNGRLDLAQAENVSRLISAKSAAAADSALAGIQVFTGLDCGYNCFIMKPLKKFVWYK